jgi:hypothetical protein
MFDHIDFDDSRQKECHQYFKNKLERCGISSEVADKLALAMMDAHIAIDIGGGGNSDIVELVELSKGWAVRNADYEFVQKLIEGPLLNGGSALIGLAVNVMTGAGTTASIATVVGVITLQSFNALYKRHISAKRHGASVGIRKTVLLCALKAINNGQGATATEVAAHVAEHFPECRYTVDEIKVDLEELRKVTTSSGGEVAFAFTADPQGELWLTSC